MGTCTEECSFKHFTGNSCWFSVNQHIRLLGFVLGLVFFDLNTSKKIIACWNCSFVISYPGVSLARRHCCKNILFALILEECHSRFAFDVEL